jgi:hypothetical protein
MDVPQHATEQALAAEQLAGEVADVQGFDIGCVRCRFRRAR